MALRRRGFVSVGAVVACCALAAACTQEPAQTSSPSPTPLATTPRESQIERQMRLDYEAAEEAYRANICGAGSAVPGRWRDRSNSCTEGHGDGLIFDVSRLSRFATIKRRAGMRRATRRSSASWQRRLAGKRVRLTSCEDSSAVRFFDERGKDVTPTGLSGVTSSV